MNFIRRWVTLFRNLFREISDEAAYARYLRANDVHASAAEWRRFSDGRYRRKYGNPKCC
jgi:tRNA G37 N-methylase TrmD